MSISGRAGAKDRSRRGRRSCRSVRGRRGEDPPAAPQARRRLANRPRQPPAGRPCLRARSRWSRPAGTARRRSSRNGPTRDDRPFAWVSLDRRDNDPVVLLRHVAAAINEIMPVDPRLLAALAAPGASIWTTVAAPGRRSRRCRRRLRARARRHARGPGAGLGRGARDPGRARPRRLDARPLEPGRIGARDEAPQRRRAARDRRRPTWRSPGARRSFSCATPVRASRTRRSPS